MDRTIQQHINDDKNELDSGSLSPQRKRHIECELEQLQNYQERHPEDIKDPTPLQLYCDQNPHALECRIYEE
jgi:hypothetical protein